MLLLFKIPPNEPRKKQSRAVLIIFLVREKINQLYSFSVNYINVRNNKQHPELCLSNFRNSSAGIRG